MSLATKLDPKKLEMAIRKCEKEALDRKALDKLGRDIVKQIQTRTRTGKGVSDTSKSTPLPSLTGEYKKTKARNASRLSTFTTSGRSRSNMTATGQMLQSMFHKVNVAARFKQITIQFKDNRNFELQPSAPRRRNAEVAQFQRKSSKYGPSYFFRLATFEERKFTRIMSEALRKCFRKNLG